MSSSVVASRAYGGRVAVALAAVGVAFFAAFFANMVRSGELFHRLGFDWTMFYAQAAALRAGAADRTYDLNEMNVWMQQLATYYTGGADFQTAQPVAYPPWFAALVLPFTLPPPPIGFALWEALSLGAALFLAYRVHQFLPRLPMLGAAALILAAAPVATALYTGQVALLLAVAVGELFVSLRAGKDVRAGLWLAVLCVKPQYAVLFGILVLWKRQWHALAGALAAGVVFVLVGVLVAGPTAFIRFPGSLAQMAEFRGPFGGPWWMINWRAVVLAARPGIGDEAGAMVVWTLAAVTVIVTLALWRGPWEPKSARFGPSFCALTLATLIASYHSHVHGATLLVVPLAAAWAAGAFSGLTRATVLAAVYVPTVILFWVAAVLNRLAVPADTDVPLWIVWPAALPATLFILSLVLMMVDLADLRAAVGRVRTLVVPSGRTA